MNEYSPAVTQVPAVSAHGELEEQSACKGIAVSNDAVGVVVLGEGVRLAARVEALAVAMADEPLDPEVDDGWPIPADAQAATRTTVATVSKALDRFIRASRGGGDESRAEHHQVSGSRDACAGGRGAPELPALVKAARGHWEIR